MARKRKVYRVAITGTAPVSAIGIISPNTGLSQRASREPSEWTEEEVAELKKLAKAGKLALPLSNFDIQVVRKEKPAPAPDDDEGGEGGSGDDDSDATKAAAELADLEGVDLADVTGTGANGRVTLDDVRAHVAASE